MNVAIIGGMVKDHEAVLRLGLNWEIWGVNACRYWWSEGDYRGIRWSRWFNLHRYAHLKRDWLPNLEREIRWANEHPDVPYYVLDDWPQVMPKQHVFPREELQYQPRVDYHAGTFDWLVAYACHLGARSISLHGITLMDSGEPMSARACLEYWCGYAEGRGIEVLAHDCDLFYQYHVVRSRTVYGYDDVKLIEE